MNHIATRELGRRGFLVVGMNPRSDNNEAAVNLYLQVERSQCLAVAPCLLLDGTCPFVNAVRSRVSAASIAGAVFSFT